MYVITDHNTQNFVLLGPIDWKPKYISNILFDEYFEEINLSNEDELRVPFEVIPGVKIRKCNATYEEINPKIHRLEGPVWSYDDENTECQATATWYRVDKTLDQVKNELKEVVSGIRWNKENEGVIVTIQDYNVWCDTSREGRDIYLQKYSLMGDDDVVNWKFKNNQWLTLTKQELGTIVSEGAHYIQSCFDWESDWAVVIDSCNTLEELDALQFTETENIE